MIRAGVSSACLYPRLLEESIYDLAVNGINHIEIFLNTYSELTRPFMNDIADTLKRFEVTCRSLHPFTCPMEPMLFFSGYKRRTADGIEMYKKYFEAMNIIGAEIFVFHGNNNISGLSPDDYCEIYSKLVETGKSFGITVAQENVSRCQSGSLKFMNSMVTLMGDNAKFILDTKQALRAGEDSFNIMHTLKNHVVHVHVSDHGEAGDCLMIGKGRFNVKQLINVLYRESPDCSVMLELYRNNFYGISDLVDNYNILCKMIDDIKVSKRPANKSQGKKRKFHKTFTEEKMDTTIRPPKRSEKILSRPATLTEHNKNTVVIVPTVRNS